MLSAEQLAFAVHFIGACRRAEHDRDLAALLVELRAHMGTPGLQTVVCGPGNDCAPQRTGTPEVTDHGGLLACQSDGAGGSACLLLERMEDATVQELLTHVAPHLLDAVTRVTPRAALSATSALTEREEQVLRWVAEGKSNWAIGQILGLAEGTVKYHLANLFRKLGVTTRTQAAALALTRWPDAGGRKETPSDA